MPLQQAAVGIAKLLELWQTQVEGFGVKGGLSNTGKEPDELSDCLESLKTAHKSYMSLGLHLPRRLMIPVRL